MTGGALGGVSATPTGLRLKILQMLQGVQSVLPSGSAMSTSSGSMTQATMVSELQAIMQAFTAVDDTRVELKQAISQVRAGDASYRLQYAQMKSAITAFFGVSSPQLVKFGLKPRLARVLTTLQKAARDARSKETRALRGTTSKKAKLALQYTGPITVTAQPAVPATSATQGGASSASSTPAAVASAPAQQAVQQQAAPLTPVAAAPQPAPAVSAGSTLTTGPKSS